MKNKKNNKLFKYINDNKKSIIKCTFLVGGVVALSTGFSSFNSNKAKDISYKEFNRLVSNNKVHELVINKNSETIYIKTESGETFKIINPDYEGFRKEMLDKDITISEAKKVDLTLGIPIVAYIAMITIMSKKFGGGKVKFKVDGKDIPDVKLDDLIGLDDIKAEFKLFIKYLKDSKIFEDAGAKMPSAIMLYGKPGTGKTQLARAVAGEANVPFFYISGSKFMQKFVGVGAERVRHLFEQAKSCAPSVIFIDEIDAIGKKRSSDGSGNEGEKDQTLNELLTQLDGFKSNEGVLVIGATNRLDSLDEALLRPGRFGKQYQIPVPANKEERLKILQFYSTNKKIDDGILEHIAKISTGKSGAYLEDFLNECAIMQVLKEKDSIDLEIVEDVLFKVTTKGSRIVSAKRNIVDNKIIAWHESGHALASKLYGEDFMQVTISGSSSGIGGFSLSTKGDEQFLKLSNLENDVKILYAGRVAESLLDEDITIGASNDIERASEIISVMISHYGMNSSRTMLNFNVIKDEKQLILEAKAISERLYKEVYEDLLKHKDTLEAIANALLEKETLYNKDIELIMNGKAIDEEQ